MDIREQIKTEVERLKQQGYRSICFWLPAYATGGGTHFWCNMALYLRENTDLTVYYMDYADGYACGILKDSGVQMLEYREEDIDFPIKEKCVIAVNSTRVIQLKRMNPENKLLLYHWETLPCAWNRVLIRGEAKAYLELCDRENALVFVDWGARDSVNQQFGTRFARRYLYVSCDPKTPRENPAGIVAEDEINLVWLGRIGVEKVCSVLNLIDSFRRYQTDRKKVLHIIGDGVKMQGLRSYAKRNGKGIDIRFVGTLPHEELDAYLTEHADILFAMGTSVLEGAALRIPSVVVRLDNKPFQGEESVWLFDTREYCIGILLQQQYRFQGRFSSFGEILDDVFLYGRKEEYAQRCYDYYLEHFGDYEKLVLTFLRFVLDSTLTMDKVEDCIGCVPYEHLRLRRLNVCGMTLRESAWMEGEGE